MTTTELIDPRLAALVLIGQNTEVVEFSVLFWTVTGSPSHAAGAARRDASASGVDLR